MTKLILSTGNIVSSGRSYIRSPGGVRSNLELTTSLRGSVEAAKEDLAEASPREAGTTVGQVSQTLQATQLPLWAELTEENTLYVPRIQWPEVGLQDESNQYDITVKLFFLPLALPDQRARYAAEALELVRKELGITAVDLLIVSFPGLSFDGDCEWTADKLNAKQGCFEDEVATWAVLEDFYRAGAVKKLGTSEFGSEKLEKFLEAVQIKPQVNQISVRDCCKVPPPLAKLAEREGIELFAHTDTVDVLPSGTLRELLGHGELGAGLLAGSAKEQGLQGDIRPRWVVKYTAVVRDRGVIENKGYFAQADLSSD
ncbi:putative glutamate--cysteine ligase regulatory subunit [Ceratocystis fimbriata CBS 114723]|uniref:GCS light chain n=1 Tax=Ceratocystis fimbriata CBS 114723 TaxID=1035309 RepID=A0A2C5WXQ1_9PEZI|nr:putative glutamate--cysteine ligase regulatory subunit [Ceratocystis fimbriata CBS 114723]